MVLAYVSLGAGSIGLLAALGYGLWLRAKSVENEKAVNISGAVREGAMAFLKREFITVAPIGAVLAVAIGLISGPSNGIAFALGAALSAISGLIAMAITVMSSPRVAQASSRSSGVALQTAFRGGAVAGLTITSMALLAVGSLYLIFGDPQAIAGVGLGASLMALFIRVGGGIYTKAADLGADLVGKIEAGIPEDDPRNPATIADNVGDNVGDAAGMGSDVYESFIVTALAAMLLGGLLMRSELVVFPLLLGGIGLLASVIGSLAVGRRDHENPSIPLNVSFLVSAVVASVTTIITSVLLLEWRLAVLLSVSSVLGIILVPLIQRLTDYYTGYSYGPVKRVVESSKVGHSANILAGLSAGLSSAMPLGISIGVVVIASYSLGSVLLGEPLYGIYATAIATMGMLSLSGIVLSIDSFGPVTDNAGGIVEMTGMGEENRKVTDKLDAIGNSAKATTKGFAIASAGLAALAMIQAFQHEASNLLGKSFDYSINNPVLITGLLIGALIPFFISSRLIGAVERTAALIVEEVRRQFKDSPGILTGSTRPDYGRVVDIATKGAISELFRPALIVISTPIVLGVLLGPVAVTGLLIGAVLSGLYLAYMMANSGAAWDNAKKLLEFMGKKRAPEHAVAVSGDLVGDPLKDTSGPSLNTVIKVLNTVSIVFVSVFVALLVF
ncbi:MAG: sodium-translocating pyrophosphatase [Aigarchaeota archaeon]|nr:sodium-translocating pyrophosphatase [Aigarchaeota archaeon]MDW8093106.1 sodium-translocating pyrophosphatase [Nitrososphaerota archaeon]